MEELDIGLEASSSRMSIEREKKDKCKCKPQLKEKHGQAGNSIITTIVANQHSTPYERERERECV